MRGTKKKAPKRVMEAHEPESVLKPNLLISINKNNNRAVIIGYPCEPITS